MTDPLGPVRDLGRRLRDEAATRGLVLAKFDVEVDLRGRSDVYVAVFLASEGALAASVAALADRAALTEMERAERDLADRAAVAEARAQLARRLAKGGDLLGDD